MLLLKHRSVAIAAIIRVSTLTVIFSFLALIVFAWIGEVTWTFNVETSDRDIVQFYTGALLIQSGHAAQLYDLESQKALQKTLLQGRDPRYGGWELLPFLSPPFVALALAPFASLSLPIFYTLSGAVQWVLIFGLMLALQHSVTGWPQSWRLALALLTVVWLPLSWALMQGQVSILLALSFTLAYLALRANRNILAGIILSVLWIKPQYVVLVLPALLIWRNWRGAGAFAGASLGLLAASWITVGSDGLIAYARLLTGIETSGAFYGMFPGVYNTLSGILFRLFGVSGWLWFVLSSLLVALTLWQARRGFGPSAFALVILTTVLVSLHTHSYDLTILLPAAALGWHALKQWPYLAAAWASLWFALELGFFVLAVKGSQFEDAPLITVPVMLLAVALLLMPRATRAAILVPARA